MQARGYAAKADHDRCLKQLSEAEHILGGSPTGVPSPWASTFDEASLATETARCLRRLGQLGAARRAAARVLTLRPAERTRSRAFARLMMISILIDEGQPEEACAMAYEVVAATKALGSVLVVRQLEVLFRRLGPYRRNVEVASFLEVLRAELHERRWLTQGVPTGLDESSGIS